MSLTKLCGAFVLASAVLCVAMILAPSARPAQAGGVVTECTDAGLTHALAGGGTVIFDCPGSSPHTILIEGAKAIYLPTRIVGDGVITLDGQNITKFFAVARGASLSLDRLTLTRGHTSVASPGAVENWGWLEVDHCQIISNTASTWYGGGIGNYDGTVIIRRSLIGWNEAYYGGGGVDNNGLVSIEDSTFISNEATASGYFNGVGGGLYNAGTVFITNSAFISNSAVWGGGISGYTTIVNSAFIGNQAADGASIYGGASMTNTIVAGGNSNCVGVITISGSNNLSSDASCAFTGPDNQINTHPRLGPLVYYGAGVPTYSLQPDSPAIDAGTNAGCPAADQRGFARPFGARCDIGAFEWHAPFPYAWYVPILRR
jgi:hypothetical protein